MKRTISYLTIAPLLWLVPVAAQTLPPVPPFQPAAPIESDLQRMERVLAIPKLDAGATVAPLERTHTPLNSVLYAIADAAGIRLDYDTSENLEKVLHKFVDIKLSSVPVEEALHRALDANGLTFTVLSAKSVMIYTDTLEGRTKWVQSIRTFPIAIGDPTAIAVILNRTLVTAAKSPLAPKSPLGPERPVIVPNKTARTITARATVDTMAEIARLIAANDKE